VAGRLADRTWARGDLTEYAYDALGQLTNIQYQITNTTPSVSFTYDRLGRQLTVDDALGSRTFAYDATTLQLTNET
jgi:YD repeat-containing protein